MLYHGWTEPTPKEHYDTTGECQHPQEYRETEGSIQFQGGDVIDTTHDVYYCAVCGEKIDQEEK